MYIDNMSRLLPPSEDGEGEGESEPLIPSDAPSGILTQYVIDDDKSNQQYISAIPKYSGSVIPTILNRTRTVLPFELNYCYLESFLENLGRYDGSNKWVVAGLLAETGIISSVPVFGQIRAANKLKKESKCPKQILCKKYDNKIVFLINVVDSKKPGLNTLFSNTIMVMTLPPSPPPPTPPPPASPLTPPIPVPAGGFDHPHSRVYTWLVDGNPKPIGENIDLIERSLSHTTIFVIDPNWVDDAVTVDWFGTKSLTHINDLIVNSGILDKSPPPSRANRGGKSRYSKKRVTKRRKTTKHRKSTKRRHRRTTRKPT